MYKKVEEEGLLLETILKLFNEQSHKKLKSYLKNNSVFDKATKVKELRMPKNIQVIGPNNFCNDTTIIFNELGKIKAKDINMLQTKINETYYLNPSDKKRKILSLKDGTYYVKIND